MMSITLGKHLPSFLTLNFSEQCLNRRPSILTSLPGFTHRQDRHRQIEGLRRSATLPDVPAEPATTIDSSSSAGGDDDDGSTSLAIDHHLPAAPLEANAAEEVYTDLPVFNDSDRSSILCSLWSLVLWRSSHGNRPLPTELRAAVLSSLKESLSSEKGEWPIGSVVAAFDAVSRLDFSEGSGEIYALWSKAIKAEQLPSVSTSSPTVLSSLAAFHAVRVLSSLARLKQPPTEPLASRLNASIAQPAALASLPPLALKNLTESLNILDWPVPPKTLILIGNVVLRYHRAMPAADIAMLTWVLARRGGGDENILKDFLPAVRAALPRCGMKQLADIARAYGKTSDDAGMDLFEAIAARAAGCIDGAALEDIARVIGAFDQVGIQPEALLEVVEEWAERRLASLSPQALALAMASFAKLGNHTPRLLETAASCAQNKMQDMQRPELAMVVWAFARLEYHPGEALLEHAERAAVSAPTAFTDRELSNLLWALARLEHVPSAENSTSIAENLVPAARRYSGTSAALVLWSFATFNHQPAGQLVQVLGQAVAKEVHSLDPQSVSLTAWALGHLRYKHTAFAEAVAKECTAVLGKFEAFTTQNLANLAWGLAKSGCHPGNEFIFELEQSSLHRLSSCSPQELFCLCWAFATWRCAAPSLAVAAAEELQERRSEFEALEFSGMVWSLARMLRPQQGAYSPWASSAQKNSLERPPTAKTASFQPFEDLEPIMPSKTTYPAYDLQSGLLSEPELAATWVLAAADRELPALVANMEPSQLSMTVWGLGRLTQALKASVLVSEEECYPSNATLKVLHGAIERQISSCNGASLAALVEGLAWLNNAGTFSETVLNCKDSAEWVDVFDLLGSHAVQLTKSGNLEIWELSSVSFHLTGIGQLSPVRSLLHTYAEMRCSEQQPQAGSKLAPKSAILLLAAMVRCHIYPPALVSSVRRRLNYLAPSYKIDIWHLAVLYEAVRDIDSYRNKAIRLSEQWKERIQEAAHGAAGQRLGHESADNHAEDWLF